MPPFLHRAIGPRGAMARTHQAAGACGGICSRGAASRSTSPAAPLLLRDTPRRKWNAAATRTSARIRASVVQRRQKCTSAELPPTFPRSASPRQAGRRPDGSAVSHLVSRCGAATAHARSKSSLKSGYPGGNVDRRMRARSHRSDRDAGLCTQAPAAIPIVPLHGAGVSRPLTARLRGEPETLDYPIQGRHPVWRR